MVENIVVGIVTGLLTSALVAILFYWIGRQDTESAYRLLKLDEAIEKLTHLDPRRRHSVLPGDGVDATQHWFLCSADIMRDTNFPTGETVLRKIAAEMRAECPETIQNPTPAVSDEESIAGQKSKARWAAAIYKLRRTLQRSLLDRIGDTLDGRV